MPKGTVPCRDGLSSTRLSNFRLFNRRIVTISIPLVKRPNQRMKEILSTSKPFRRVTLIVLSKKGRSAIIAYLREALITQAAQMDPLSADLLLSWMKRKLRARRSTHNSK